MPLRPCVRVQRGYPFAIGYRLLASVGDDEDVARTHSCAGTASRRARSARRVCSWRLGIAIVVEKFLSLADGCRVQRRFRRSDDASVAHVTEIPER